MLSLRRSLVQASRQRVVGVRVVSSSSKVPQTKDSDAPATRQPSTPTTTSSVPAPLAAQAPNFPTTWSTNQRARAEAYTDVRFEQTALEFQPQPLSALQLINEEPVRMVHGRKAVCDGGWGPLGHPKIFINLDKPGHHACGYCGIRFEQVPSLH